MLRNKTVKPEQIFLQHVQYLVKSEWEGQREKCVWAVRKKEWKKYDTYKEKLFPAILYELFC